MTAATLLASLVAALFLQRCCGALTSNSVGDSCTTPDNKPGVCRLIKQCPALITLLEGWPTQERNLLMRNATCRVRGHELIVCCAGAASMTGSNTVPPEKPDPTTSTSDRTTWTSNVANHRNLRLLPPVDICSVDLPNKLLLGVYANFGQYPFIARLGYWTRNRTVGEELSYYCAGSLINSNYVLTAANCVSGLPAGTRLGAVRLGEFDTNTEKDCVSYLPEWCLPPVLDYEVEETVVHPEYNPKEMTNDIALVRLRGRVDFEREEYVGPVCLPVDIENQNLRLNDSVFMVAGWGEGTPWSNNTVRDGWLSVVPLDKCRNIYASLKRPVNLTEQQLCAVGKEWSTSIPGDAGGPLLVNSDVGGDVKRLQVGVMSFAPRHFVPGGTPSVFTRVGHYMDWILSSMRP